MGLLLLYFFLAVVVSFFCSLLEAVMLSTTSVYVRAVLKKKRAYGQVLKSLKHKIDRPLSAILTLNTVANTVGATGVGAQVHTLYGSSYVAVASGILTFVILIFSEIIPKTLGASYWRTLAPFAAYAVKGLIVATYPFVQLFEKLNNVLSRKKITSVTREDMIVTAEMGVSEGTIGQKESRMIKNLLMLDTIKVSEIMTPRAVILAFDKNKTIKNVMSGQEPIRFSRVPLYSGSLDQVEGLIHRYKILEAYSHDLFDIPLKDYMQAIHFIPDNISVAAVLDQFIKRKEHIFMAVDSYGVLTGLVTLEDAVETLLGVEIVDEFDSVADMRKYALEQWQARKQKQVGRD